MRLYAFDLDDEVLIEADFAACVYRGGGNPVVGTTFSTGVLGVGLNRIPDSLTTLSFISKSDLLGLIFSPSQD